MSREIVEAINGLEQEKGIDAETLMAALEDALLSAYKKSPGRRQVRPRRPRPRHRRLPRLRADPAARAGGEAPAPQVAEEQEPTVDPETGELREPEEPELDPELLAPYEDQITYPRRHPRRLRPDRRPDRQAGDPAADPRGRAADDVRGVPGPRRRADHGDHPAVRQPLHAGPAARARRGAAAALRAGLERALRPRHAGQGRDHRRLRRGQGPEHRRLAPQPRADQEAVRARGARDRRRASSRSSASPASPATARRSP